MIPSAFPAIAAFKKQGEDTRLGILALLVLRPASARSIG